MHRIQVQLTAEQERMLREIARLRGSSISALIRDGIDQIIDPERQKLERSRQRALRLIGAFSDKRDVARRHDEYLAANEPGGRARKRSAP
jgi:hypothetical protein